MSRQFVRCQFKPGDKAAYTYHYDGGMPLVKGDQVIVATKRGEATVTVVGVSDPPAFETKPILRMEHEPKRGPLL